MYVCLCGCLQLESFTVTADSLDYCDLFLLFLLF